MDPQSSYGSMTCRLKQHKRRRDYLNDNSASGFATKHDVHFDVAQLVPQRPYPIWVKSRLKGAGAHEPVNLPLRTRRGSETRRNDALPLRNGTMMLDLNNMRKDWKSRSTLRTEGLQRARVTQNRRAEAVKDFPGDVRPVAIPCDSPVALYASMGGGSSRKRLDPSLAANGTSCMERESTFPQRDHEAESSLLTDATYLAIDQSKLPLEVHTRCYFLSVCC